MQSNNPPGKTHLSQKQKEQRRGYANDQQNIKEIVEKHPYKKWEDILDNASTTD